MNFSVFNQSHSFWVILLLTKCNDFWLLLSTAKTKAVVPNLWAVDQYWSMGQLVPGHTERMCNFCYFRFIYYLFLNDVLYTILLNWNPSASKMNKKQTQCKRASGYGPPLPPTAAVPVFIRPLRIAWGQMCPSHYLADLNFFFFP